MLKLKLQYFGHLMRRADSFEKILTSQKSALSSRVATRVSWSPLSGLKASTPYPRVSPKGMQDGDKMGCPLPSPRQLQPPCRGEGTQDAATGECGIRGQYF